MAEQEQEEHGGHPGVGQYVEIAIILAVVTGIEVGLYFADVPRSIETPALLILTVIKFLLVVLWFMHLRFDSRLFRRLFLTGVALATVVYAIVAATFYLGSGYLQDFGGIAL